MTYLGFTIGQALEPFVAMLIPIIDNISEWVVQNDKLAAGLLVSIGALGTLLALGGSLKLAFDGFYQLALMIAPAISNIGTTISTVAAEAGVGFVASTIGLWIAAIVAFVVAWKTNFAGIRDYVGSIFVGIGSTIKAVFGSLVQIFSGIMDILKALFTGDFDLLMQGLVKTTKGALKIVADLFLFLGAFIINTMSFALNLVSSSIVNLVKLMVGAIRAAIQAYNAIPGLPDIGTGWLDKSLDFLEKIKRGVQNEYTSPEQLKQNSVVSTVYNTFNINVDRSTDQSVVAAVLSTAQGRGA
jgi:hypothetical protein